MVPKSLLRNLKPMVKFIFNSKFKSSVILLLGIIFCTLPFKSNILYNKSDSLPYKLYFLLKGTNYQQGDLVAIKNFATQYTNNQHFTKQIIGTNGDLITIEDEYILINGIKCAKLKSKTKDNKKLTPIAAQTIPSKYFFVIAEHKDSFDSRYQEFGLVPKDCIEGKVYPIW